MNVQVTKGPYATQELPVVSERPDGSIIVEGNRDELVRLTRDQWRPVIQPSIDPRLHHDYVDYSVLDSAGDFKRRWNSNETGWPN